MQFTNNPNNLILDDQYFMEVPVTQGASNVPTGAVGFIGTASRGPLNTPTLVTSYQDFIKKFGEVDAAFALTGAIGARGIFKQGNANVYFARIQATTTAAASASVAINDTATTPKLVMTLTAATPGTWGNSLNVTVAAGTKTGTFKISLQYGAESETWDNLIIAQPTTPIVGAVIASTIFGPNGQSQLATSTYPATPNLTIPATGTFTMTSGVDGAGAIATDYVGATGATKTGLYALDSAPINIIFAAEQSDPTINAALIANAQNITQNGGLPRIAVITFPKSSVVSGLSTLTTAMDTDRAFPAYPWFNIYDPITTANQTVSPMGYVAGVIASLKPHQSPGNKPIQGIIGVDPAMNIGPADMIAMIQARVNPVGVPTPAGPLGIRTGLTLSQTTETSQVYVRRMKDYIDQLVFSVGGQFVDAPITADLMRQVYQSVDNILYPMKSPATASDQMIADYKIICDGTNNPSTSTSQNRLICDYGVKLLNIDRFMIFRTQIGAGVVISSNK
ncbi:MAG: hypothetical protein JWN30_199 [Bacilli bacterium]|nr:hypothetical protein [Bacilli bacterium]